MNLENNKLIYRDNNLLVVDFTPKSMSPSIELNPDTALERINTAVQSVNKHWCHHELDGLLSSLEEVVLAIEYYKSIT